MFKFFLKDYADEEAPPSMAPPPLPPDYGNSGGPGGGGPIGWSSSTTAAAATSVPISNPAPPANDDWGWSTTNDTPSTDRYQNAPADDPWSANAAPNNSDNNYNQAGVSSSDPFDPFDQPPQQKSSTAPVTASANQVTSPKDQKKIWMLFMFELLPNPPLLSSLTCSPFDASFLYYVD